MLVRGDMSGVGNVLPDFLKLCCKLDCGLRGIFVILTFLYSHLESLEEFGELRSLRGEKRPSEDRRTSLTLLGSPVCKTRRDNQKTQLLKVKAPSRLSLEMICQSL